MKCPCCHTQVEELPGIGAYCPKKGCHVGDSLDGLVVEFKGQWYIHPRRINGRALRNRKEDEAI